MKRNVWTGMLAALLVMTVFFSGCSMEAVQEAAQKAQNKVVEAALEATVDTMANVALKEYEQASPAMDCLQERVELKVIASQITAEGMMATCEISAPDLTTFIETLDPNDYINDGVINEEKLLNDVMAAIKEAPITQQTVTIGLQSTEDGGYEPTDMEAFINAYTGGALDLLMELYEEYIPQ